MALGGPGSSVGIATESNPGGGEIFRTRPDRPWDPPSLLCNGYRVFPGVKRPGHGADHPPPLTSRLRMSRAITLLPLWALGSLLYSDL
jgi:hypothetical protein